MMRISPLHTSAQDTTPQGRRAGPAERSTVPPADTKLFFAVSLTQHSNKVPFISHTHLRAASDQPGDLRLERGESAANSLAELSASICNTQSWAPASDGAAQRSITAASSHQCSGTHCSVRLGHFESHVFETHICFRNKQCCNRQFSESESWCPSV